MRLVQYDEDGGLSITDDLVCEDTIPPYAILSHRWGDDAEELSYEDIARNAGGDKQSCKQIPRKIRFCVSQARQDGLQYVWVDTCCINKGNKAEHSHAIRSMFRWYRNAARCYVYLSDVCSSARESDNDMNTRPWDSDFRQSKWFTRGWTLQELLAPSSVEFFSCQGQRLGDKVSLKQDIHEITGIPLLALEGAPLSQFDVSERLRWREGRETKRDEDGAYALQGILDVELAPVYGEGAAGAFERLRDEIHKLERCVQDIYSTDPRNDKKRIEETKGGLLADSYRWVLDNTTFQQWQQDLGSRLLWIKGDPGKGKTMLLCGIINELHRLMPDTILMSYFFCQATDSRLNTATVVLRGLLYMLVDQQPSLISHIRKKHDRAGKSLFEDANAWTALTEIFADIVRDPSLRPTYLIIDALDECVTADLSKLLEFVAKQSSASPRVKWIVSSRNWPDIEAQLERAGHKIKLSLELNAESVAAAVNVFIEQRVDQLSQDKQYKGKMRDAVLQHLKSNATETFLWVALVCQELERTAPRHVLKKLASFPQGLDALYERMMQQMSECGDDAEICRCVLASTAILYRPVTIPELIALVEQLEDVSDDVREIISLCGSFLTLREDTIYFVHQSAKDFLFKKASSRVFSHGIEDIHRTIFLKSLAILSRTLHRDMYGADALGRPVEDITLPDPDPLAVSRYPCIYWIDHMLDARADLLRNDSSNFEAVDDFLRTKYLYWLEGLSLCRSVDKGVISMTKLCSLVQVRCRERT
jgi:hypothetical protein